MSEHWENEQTRLASMVSDTDGFDLNGVRYVGGVDLGFVKDNPSVACAAFAIVKMDTLELVYQDLAWVPLTVPYVSGFLAFREVPPLMTLIEKARVACPDVFPEVILVDGNGILHPRRCGHASHLGILLDVPTIGVAKTFLHVDGNTEKAVRHEADLRNKKHGDWVPIVGKTDGVVYGAAVRPTDITIHPIFVSVGHKVSLATAITLVLRCCKHRIPEPLRYADLLGRAFIAKNPVPSEYWSRNESTS